MGINFNNKYLAVMFYSIVAVLFCYPLLENIYTSCHGDWDYFQTLNEAIRKTVINYHQLPLWNPYTLGGMPLLGNPQSSFPSITFILTVLFGVVVGMKLAVLAYTVVGLFGMWLVSGEFGAIGLSRVVSAFIFIFSSSWAFRIAEGHFVWMPVVYFPFILLGYIRSDKSNRWMMAGAGFFALMIYDAGTYVLVFSMIFLSAYAIAECVIKFSWHPVSRLIWIILIGAGLAAPKLFPMIELMSYVPRVAGETDSVSIEAFLGSLVERDSNPAATEYGGYIGLVVLVLYCVGMIRIKGLVPLKVASVFLLLVLLGNLGPWSPWTLLHKLPVLENLRMPARGMMVFNVSTSLLATLYTTQMIRGGGKTVKIICTVLLIYIAINLFHLSKVILPCAFVPAQPVFHTKDGILKLDSPATLYQIDQKYLDCETSINSQFIQLRVPGIERFKHGAWSDQFLRVLDNKGVVDAYEPIPFKSYVKASGDPGYKGEYYSDNVDGQCHLIFWSPNKMEYDVLFSRPGRLVVNQNYWVGWHASNGQLTTQQGLLAVDIPAGMHHVVLWYAPYSFFGGCVFMLMTFVFVLINIHRQRFRERETL